MNKKCLSVPDNLNDVFELGKIYYVQEHKNGFEVVHEEYDYFFITIKEREVIFGGDLE